MFNLYARVRKEKWCWTLTVASSQDKLKSRVADRVVAPDSVFEIIKINLAVSIGQSDDTALKYQLYWLIYRKKKVKQNLLGKSQVGSRSGSCFFCRWLPIEPGFFTALIRIRFILGFRSGFLKDRIRIRLILRVRIPDLVLCRWITK